MADNITVPPTGSGDATPVIATDDVSSVHYQYVKLVDGTADSTAKIGGDATNGLDVDVTRLPALAAGTNAIGKLAANSGVDIGDVDVTSVPADPFGANADAASATGSISAKLRFIAATGIPVTGTVTVGSHAVTNAGTFATQIDGNALTALQLIDDPVKADDAGFTVGTDKVMMVGGVAVAHGSNPDAADANDAGAPIMNRHRVPFNIGGHPNAVTSSARRADADNGVTDGAIGPGTVNTGTKVVVTRLTVTCSNANTVNVAVKVGFAAANIAADSTTGAAGVLVDHEGVPPGGGFTIGDGSGILGIGADGEELRWTVDDPVGGHVCITVTYYTIES